MITRRRFLQVGLAGAAVLAGVHLALRNGGPREPGPRTLDAGEAALVAALAPVVLAGALPAEPESGRAAVREVVEAFDRALAGLEPAVREEVRDLLGLLAFAPTRFALAGLARPVAQSRPEDVAAFLQRWRTSRFDLLRAAYQALTQLLQAAWFGNARAWPAIGYPGPPRLEPR